MKITATVITFNEEHNIADALRSLEWADEVIVVDSESTDRTVEIARQFTDRVLVRKWTGYSAQKNFAAEQASNDWIFSLDADERVSQELKKEIERIKWDKSEIAGFEMPRLTYYLGRWIHHSGWRPDYKLRLYDRRRGRWEGEFVHEKLALTGAVQRLSGDILHHTVRDSSEHHHRMDQYTTLAARQAFEEGKASSTASLLISPAMMFVRSYFFRLGFLDGIQGIAIARFAAHYEFLKNLKLWELRRGEDKSA
jgi:glycosyltransferase involved in cell wall biosynthesis